MTAPDDDKPLHDEADVLVSTTDRAPFAHGSVFVVLNVHWDLTPSETFARLRRQARLAAEGGFDGVCLTEHHGGFPGYLPVPLQAIAILLSEMPRGWAAPNPMIAAFRSPATIVEDAAWLHAAFPGRVGLAFAAGFMEDEFTGFGVPFGERAHRFREVVGEVSDALGGSASNEMLRADPAVRAATGQIPLALSVGGPRHIRFAAKIGAAITPRDVANPDSVRAAFSAYVDAGGTGARIMQRWVFLGVPPVEAISQYHAGHSNRVGRAFDVAPFADPDPARMAEHVLDWAQTADATAIAIRFHLGPLPPDVVDAQITSFAADVLPQIREGLAERTPRTP